MHSIMLWLNIHRMLVVMVCGVAFWVGAYAWYFHPMIRAYLLRGRPHNWSIDLAAKKAVSRGRTEV